MPGTRAARALEKNTLNQIDDFHPGRLPGRIEVFIAKAGLDRSSGRLDAIHHFRDYTGKHSGQPMAGTNAGMRSSYRTTLED